MKQESCVYFVEVSIIAMAIVFTLFGIVSCVSDIPLAMGEETQNQRHIAAGKWKHMPGAFEYQQFTENNK